MSPFRFRKRVTIFPGVRVNFSNRVTRPSVSIGPRRLQWNSRTKRVSADLPGPVNWQSQPIGGRRQARATEQVEHGVRWGRWLVALFGVGGTIALAHQGWVMLVAWWGGLGL